jgi:hypothetical protein
MRNFDKYFQRQYNIAMVRIELELMKLQQGAKDATQTNLQGQTGRYVRQPGQPPTVDANEPGSAEPQPGTDDIPAGQ